MPHTLRLVVTLDQTGLVYVNRWLHTHQLLSLIVACGREEKQNGGFLNYSRELFEMFVEASYCELRLEREVTGSWVDLDLGTRK